MSLLRLVLISCFLLHQVFCVVLSTDTQAMSVWNHGSQAASHNPWLLEPTWHATTDISDFRGRNPGLKVSYQNVLDLARMHWNWLKIQQPTGWQTGGVSLVAVMFDARGRSFTASTVPHGPRKAWMNDNTHIAPLWIAAAKPNPGETPFHAEDGVYFNWESELKSSVEDNKFPEGSMIAVWGSFSSGTIDGASQQARDRFSGQEIALCSQLPSNKALLGQPTCQQVADTLGVGHTDPLLRLNSANNELGPDEIEWYGTGELGQLSIDASTEACEEMNAQQQDFEKRFAVPKAYSDLGPRNQDTSTIASACSLTFSTSASVTTITSLPVGFGDPPKASTMRTATTTAASSTAGPSLSCVYQDATPEDGTEAACTCVSGSSTTVVKPMTISSVSVITQSCAYSTWPSSAGTVTTPPQTVSTNFPGCQLCTILGPNEADCSPLPSSVGCTPQKTSTILSMDTQGVTVGTLSGASLFAAVTSGIDELCQVPSNGAATGSFTCRETATATLASNVKHTDNPLGQTDWSTEAELIMQITEASYDSLEWYATNRDIIAAYVQNSTQNNCQTLTAYGEVGITGRTDISPGPTITKQSFNICKVGSNYQLIEVDPSSNGPARELSISLRFQEQTDGNIFCEFLKDVLEFIELTVNLVTDTEEAIPEELKVDQELLAACEEVASAVAVVNSVTSAIASLASAIS